jgi:hypothetical protein
MKKLIVILLRILMALGLIMLGVKGLSEVHVAKGTVLNTIEKLEAKLEPSLKAKINLEPFKNYPVEIVYFKELCLIYGGLLLVFGLSLSKCFIFISFLLHVILFNNIALDHSETGIKYFSYSLAILGGALSFK